MVSSILLSLTTIVIFVTYLFCYMDIVSVSLGTDYGSYIGYEEERHNLFYYFGGHHHPTSTSAYAILVYSFLTAALLVSVSAVVISFLRYFLNRPKNWVSSLVLASLLPLFSVLALFFVDKFKNERAIREFLAETIYVCKDPPCGHSTEQTHLIPFHLLFWFCVVSVVLSTICWAVACSPIIRKYYQKISSRKKRSVAAKKRGSNLAALEAIHGHYKKGVLVEEEYALLKKNLLNGKGKPLKEVDFNRLQKLKELRESGAIEEDEFVLLKRETLGL